MRSMCLKNYDPGYVQDNQRMRSLNVSKADHGTPLDPLLEALSRYRDRVQPESNPLRWASSTTSSSSPPRPHIPVHCYSQPDQSGLRYSVIPSLLAVKTGARKITSKHAAVCT